MKCAHALDVDLPGQLGMVLAATGDKVALCPAYGGPARDAGGVVTA